MMHKKEVYRLLAALALCGGMLCFAPAARAAAVAGSEDWQPYLDSSPISFEDFAADPLGALQKLLPDGLAGTAKAAVRKYAAVLQFLLLASLLSFLAAGTPDAALLELASVGGCGVLLWTGLLDTAQALSGKITQWQSFLMGFLPVYAGVLTAGGEAAAGASVVGLLLTALCFLAQVMGAWLVPLLECYLALSIACCVSGQSGIGAACKAAGELLRKGLGIAGKALVLLLSVQRVFTAQVDSQTVRAGKLLASTVPVIGQTLSGAAESVLAGVQLLKSSLGFAALAVLGAEFVPLYLELLLQSVLLAGCGLLCSLAQNERCGTLFGCLVQAVQCMAAATALYFGAAVFGTVLMFAAGGGG